jgi:cytidylate kinase
LIASIEHRLKHVQEVFKYSKPEAMEYIKSKDVNRKKYLKSHFFRDPDDATLYHLIFNTGQFTYLESAWVIADTLKMKFPQCFIE